MPPAKDIDPLPDILQSHNPVVARTSGCGFHDSARRRAQDVKGYIDKTPAANRNHGLDAAPGVGCGGTIAKDIRSAHVLIQDLDLGVMVDYHVGDQYGLRRSFAAVVNHEPQIAGSEARAGKAVRSANERPEPAGASRVVRIAVEFDVAI